MDTYKFINGIRTDTVNDLNYTRLIYDKLYVGLLSRNSESWGSKVLIGLEFDDSETYPRTFDVSTYANLDLTYEDYYVALFNTDYDATYTAYTESSENYYVNLYKILRINEKWMLIENTSIQATYDAIGDNTYIHNVSVGDEYNNFRNSTNLTDDNYMFNIYKLATSNDYDTLDSATVQNSENIIIRYKNSDLDFYDANKTVYLSPSGMGYPVDGFEDLVLLENSKDSTSIKLVNVPDSTIAKINSGELDLTGRIFDVVDSSTNEILIKGLLYNANITLNDTSFLKFIYPTQNGDKVVLATIDLYETIFQIYPDYTVNLLTEIINDNTPPGIDVTQCMDNYIYDSLFLRSNDITDGIDDLNFINTHGEITDINFVSLANERNRLFSGANGYVLDNSVFIGSSYSDAADWANIKKYNLNKLLLNWTLSIENSSTEPSSPTANDLWYDTNDSSLKIFTETLTDTSDLSYVDASASLIAIEGSDWTTKISTGDTIVLSGAEDGTGANNQIYTVSTVDYNTSVAGHTAIVVTDNTGMVDETLDANPDETINVWKPIDNDVRQVAIFYMEDFGLPVEYTDLIYIANINKISITDDINIQLII